MLLHRLSPGPAGYLVVFSNQFLFCLLVVGQFTLKRWNLGFGEAYICIVVRSSVADFLKVGFRFLDQLLVCAIQISFDPLMELRRLLAKGKRKEGSSGDTFAIISAFSVSRTDRMHSIQAGFSLSNKDSARFMNVNMCSLWPTSLRGCISQDSPNDQQGTYVRCSSMSFTASG